MIIIKKAVQKTTTTTDKLIQTLLFISSFLIICIKCNNESNGIVNQNMFNRMVCENEKLQLSCSKPEHVIKIERAYYGRYSITPCNKNHLKYTKGCTANESLPIIRKL